MRERQRLLVRRDEHKIWTGYLFPSLRLLSALRALCCFLLFNLNALAPLTKAGNPDPHVRTANHFYFFTAHRQSIKTKTKNWVKIQRKMWPKQTFLIGIVKVGTMENKILVIFFLIAIQQGMSQKKQEKKKSKHSIWIFFNVILNPCRMSDVVVFLFFDL